MPIQPRPDSTQPETARAISIDGTERVFLCGMTGSGKTFWAMHMLASLPRLVVIDLKGSDEIAKWDWLEPGREAADKLERGRGARIRVKVGDNLEASREQALEYMRLAYAAGGCVVYIDEIYALVPPRSAAPAELNAIWTRGRELGVGAWAATQRPSWVPREIISEAEWTVCFRLKLKDDRKTMADNMGEEVLTPITDEHGFFITRVNWPRPIYKTRLNTEVRLNGTKEKELA